jgi:hypothetical protein
MIICVFLCHLGSHQGAGLLPNGCGASFEAIECPSWIIQCQVFLNTTVAIQDRKTKPHKKPAFIFLGDMFQWLLHLTVNTVLAKSKPLYLAQAG